MRIDLNGHVSTEFDNLEHSLHLLGWLNGKADQYIALGGGRGGGGGGGGDGGVVRGGIGGREEGTEELYRQQRDCDIHDCRTQ